MEKAEKRFQGLDGTTLKWIAMVTMLIDHIGHSLVWRGVIQVYPVYTREYAIGYYAYFAMRSIGRIAFPIYAFMIVEGFIHTRDWRRYACSLGIFALISEIPFDLLTLETGWMDLSSQNVFFTLLLGLLTVKAGDTVLKKEPGQRGTFWFLMIVAAGGGAAWLLHTDYSYTGVVLIALFYWFRYSRNRQCLAGAIWGIALLWEVLCYCIGITASMVLLWLYNGKRRPTRWKYVYYLFYPVHLLILSGICRLWLG